MPCGPLADDWFFWDPETIFAYPHSREPDLAAGDSRAPLGEPQQLDLFEVHAHE